MILEKDIVFHVQTPIIQSFTFDMHFQRNAINQIILNMNIYHPHGNYLCLHLAPWKGGKNEKKDKKHINFLSEMETVSNLLKE